MTTTEEEAPTSCANCGKEEKEAKLKACLACMLVKYCGRDCQIAHRPQHKKACKKRAAELHDEALFKQPLQGDDCPICFMMLPSTEMGKTFMACCGKIICDGCRHGHCQRTQSNGSIPTCPFCRATIPMVKESIEVLKKRVDADDSEAIYQLGEWYMKGDQDMNIKKDIDRAIKLFHRAAGLGSAAAYRQLGVIYDTGNGVSEDEVKAKQYYEKGALAGDVIARLSLGNYEAIAGSFDRASRHWLIAASFGDIRAVNQIKRAMIKGYTTKEQYAQALRQYQAYLNEVRSEHRDKAAAYDDRFEYLIEDTR